MRLDYTLKTALKTKSRHKNISMYTYHNLCHILHTFFTTTAVHNVQPTILLTGREMCRSHDCATNTTLVTVGQLGIIYDVYNFDSTDLKLGDNSVRLCFLFNPK